MTSLMSTLLDFAKQINDQLNPRIAMALHEFIDNAKNITSIQMLLDLHIPHRTLPPGLEYVKLIVYRDIESLQQTLQDSG